MNILSTDDVERDDVRVEFVDINDEVEYPIEVSDTEVEEFDIFDVDVWVITDEDGLVPVEIDEIVEIIVDVTMVL
jgi:hypothetical protein